MKIRNITLTTILVIIACFALLPKVQAVVPAPDGGYPNGNTAEGQKALLSSPLEPITRQSEYIRL